MLASKEFQKRKALGWLLGQLMGSCDSLGGLKGLENVGMKVEGLGEQPASNPLLPNKKEVSLAGSSG